MTDSYFVRVRGRTLGPYDIDTIRQMARKAQVGRSHEVSLDGISWASASTYPEIFERPQSQPQAGDSRLAGGGNYELGAPDSALASGAGTSPPVGTSPRGVMWHYTIGGQQQSTPIDQQSLINLIATGRVGPDDSVWNEGMSNWLTVAYVPELAAYALPNPASLGVHGRNQSGNQGFPSPEANIRIDTGGVSPGYQKFVSKKITAGIFALLLGPLGIHKFVLGLTTGGVTTLVLFCLLFPIPVLGMISLIEGILYLTKTDEQFFRDYAIDKKQWF